MNKFIPCAVYDIDGELLGWAIKNSETPKLQSTNLYLRGEEGGLNEQLSRLNEDLDLKAHWPHPQDSEVQVMLNDASFMPIEYISQEVVDDENSYYVWQKDPETGEDLPELDEDASVIVFKTAQVPARPTDVMLRIKAASEQIARQRARDANLA